MSMTVPVGGRADERQSKGCMLSADLSAWENGVHCCAAELTLQPCGCLSGCAHRLKGPARVYPSGPEATLAPPTGLVGEKQVRDSGVTLQLRKMEIAGSRKPYRQRESR